MERSDFNWSRRDECVQPTIFEFRLTCLNFVKLFIDMDFSLRSFFYSHWKMCEMCTLWSSKCLHQNQHRCRITSHHIVSHRITSRPDGRSQYDAKWLANYRWKLIETANECLCPFRLIECVNIIFWIVLCAHWMYINFVMRMFHKR